MSDVRDAIRDAIANGIEPARLPGLEATVDRVIAALYDPRQGEPVGLNEVAGLTVAFKALLVRSGGHVEITEAELLHARELLARVDATPQLMIVQVVEGVPPDTPRFALERSWAPGDPEPPEETHSEHEMVDPEPEDT